MPNKLRVTHIITQLELGGAQQNTLYTFGHLDLKRYEPSVISGKGGILDEEANKMQLPVYFIPSLVRPISPFKDFLATFQIYRKLRDTRPHIVHTHSSKAGILGRIAAYMAGVPIIIHTYHGFGFTPIQKPFIRKLLINVERLCAKLSTHLIFVSEENKHTAEELGILHEIQPSFTSLIRSGIILNERRHSTLRKDRSIPENAWVVISVGNFKPQKNPLDLIQTAKLVLENSPETHFVLVGDGILRSKAEILAKKLKIENRIHFMGWQTRGAAALMPESNVFLLTSLWEGLPRAMIEAMAAGLPVVAYGVDGVKDIIIDGVNGFLIPPYNLTLTADKLLFLESNKELAKKMGEKARNRILSNNEFDINNMVRQQEELYSKLYDEVPLKEYYEHLWSVQPKT